MAASPRVLLQGCCPGPAASTRLSLLADLWKYDFSSHFLASSQTGLTLAADAELAGGAQPSRVVKTTFSLGIGLKPLLLRWADVGDMKPLFVLDGISGPAAEG